ncbi:MAG: hypothetical protein ACLU0O_01275 [Collinsella sp.]
MACAAGACFAPIPREVLPFVLSCARAVIGMSWKAGVAAELIGMAVGTVGERIYRQSFD